MHIYLLHTSKLALARSKNIITNLKAGKFVKVSVSPSNGRAVSIAPLAPPPVPLSPPVKPRRRRGRERGGNPVLFLGE